MSIKNQDLKLNLLEELEDLIEEEDEKIDYDYKYPSFKVVKTKTVGSSSSMGDRKVGEIDKDTMELLMEEQEKEKPTPERELDKPPVQAMRKQNKSHQKEVKEGKGISHTDLSKIQNEISKMSVFVKKVLTNTEEQKHDEAFSRIEEELKILEPLEKSLSEIDKTLKSFKEEKSQELFSKLEVFMKEYVMSSKEVKEEIENISQNNKKVIKNFVEKIIEVELSQSSKKIIEVGIENIYGNIKEAKNIKLHLNPKNLDISETLLSGNDELEIVADELIEVGDFLITSSKGNFSSKIKEKVELVLSTMDLV